MIWLRECVYPPWNCCYCNSSIREEEFEQEEISKKVIVFTVTLTKVGGRMTAKALKAAMRKYLDEQAKAKTKIKAKLDPNRVRHGKQTVKQLMNQNTGLTNIEITDQNIKSFERVAQKYQYRFCIEER